MLHFFILLIQYLLVVVEVIAVICTALSLLFGWQEGHPACKKLDWWGTGMVICLERDADLLMSQLMPLSLTVSCFSKNPDWFYLSGAGSPGQSRKKSR